MKTSTLIALLAGGVAVYVLTKSGGVTVAASAGPAAHKPSPNVQPQPTSDAWVNPLIGALGNLGSSIVNIWKPTSAPAQSPAGAVTTGPDTSGTGSAPTPVPWWEGGEGMSDEVSNTSDSGINAGGGYSYASGNA